MTKSFSPTAMRFYRGLDAELNVLAPLLCALGATWSVIGLVEVSGGGYVEMKAPANEFVDVVFARVEVLSKQLANESANPPQWRQKSGCLVQPSRGTLFGRQRDYVIFLSPQGLEIQVARNENDLLDLSSCSVSSSAEFAELQTFMGVLAALQGPGQ